jgi:hypothetical protein
MAQSSHSGHRQAVARRGQLPSRNVGQIQNSPTKPTHHHCPATRKSARCQLTRGEPSSCRNHSDAARHVPPDGSSPCSVSGRAIVGAGQRAPGGQCWPPGRAAVGWPWWPASRSSGPARASGGQVAARSDQARPPWPPSSRTDRLGDRFRRRFVTDMAWWAGSAAGGGCSLKPAGRVAAIQARKRPRQPGVARLNGRRGHLVASPRQPWPAGPQLAILVARDSRIRARGSVTEVTKNPSSTTE